MNQWEDEQTNSDCKFFGGIYLGGGKFRQTIVYNTETKDFGNFYMEPHHERNGSIREAWILKRWFSHVSVSNMHDTGNKKLRNKKSWREAEWDNLSENRDSVLTEILATVLWRHERQSENWHWHRDLGWEFEMIPLWYICLSSYLKRKMWASAEHAEHGERNRKFYKAEKIF